MKEMEDLITSIKFSLESAQQIIVMSSAKATIFEFGIEYETRRSLIRITQRRGDNAPPCGQPFDNNFHEQYLE